MLFLQVHEQLEAARAVEADLRGQVHSSQQEVQSETQQLQASRLAVAELEVQLAASREQGQAKSESIQRVKEQQQQVGIGGSWAAVTCCDAGSGSLRSLVSCSVVGLPSLSTSWLE